MADATQVFMSGQVLRIMFGVNDYWCTVAFGSKFKDIVESYGTGFKALLKRTKEALSEIQIIICEPIFARAADAQPGRTDSPG